MATAVKNEAHIAGLSNSEVDVPNLVILIKYLYFERYVTPRPDIKKTCSKEIGMRA